MPQNGGVLLDTNVLILHVSKQEVIPPVSHSLFISVLTVFELLRLPGMTREEETALRELIGACEVIALTPAIAERAAFLGRTHHIGAVDLLIAATALELKIPLITKNFRDFKNIPNLLVRGDFSLRSF